MVVNKVIQIHTSGQGLYEITPEVEAIIEETAVSQGLCTVFLQHTSASLLIQENADPSARSDLERWLNRLVPEKDELYRHTAEGPDDMPAHIKSMLTATNLSIPVSAGQLCLGTWQGIYLWEHRKASHRRKLVVSILS